MWDRRVSACVVFALPVKTPPSLVAVKVQALYLLTQRARNPAQCPAGAGATAVAAAMTAFALFLDNANRLIM